MKKFCNKISKQQWRVSVPNVGFRKSPSKNDDAASDSSKSKKRISSGSYDVAEAQKEYDRNRSLSNSIVYLAAGANSDSDEDDDRYEDARTSNKNSSIGRNDDGSRDDLLLHSDNELYVDVDVKSGVAVSKNVNANNSQFEYDVPRISFKFFERNRSERDSYEDVAPPPPPPPLMKTEVKIILSAPPEEDEPPSSGPERAPLSGLSTGSDPNLMSLVDEGDGFYKIPRKLEVNTRRLSQSLDDFYVDAVEVARARPAAPPASCSRAPQQDGAPIGSGNSSAAVAADAHPTNVELYKARKRLPLRLRRPMFLKRPKKAVESWNNFRTRFGTILTEQASTQRVGVYDEKDKVSINFDQMYKHSKSKCRKVIQNTGKIFSRKQQQQQQHYDDNDNGGSFRNDNQDDVVLKPFKSTASNINNNTSMSSVSDEEKKEFDFSSLTSAFKKKNLPEGQHGFDDLRRYVKQGGDFCKELATILQERAETESQYAKSLSKLSAKLARACREGVGGMNEAWKQAAIEMEGRAEVHRVAGIRLLEETAKPLRALTENQHRTRKQCEAAVDKAAKLLADWRTAEAKGKKHSHACARDNEKLQDAAVLDTSRTGKLTLSRSTSLIQMAHVNNKTNSEKETAKLECKKRKAEDAVKKADIEYYTLCVRAERARLEWESAVLKGVNSFQSLEEERLQNLKNTLNGYFQHSNDIGPKLVDISDKLRNAVVEVEPTKDLITFINLRQSSQQVSEQLLPDFYCEHITLAMNRERRKQALIKLLHLIRQDIERERKSKNGLENLSKAIRQTPNFGAEDSQQNVCEKLYHMKSMLTYLEGARYKVHNALSELDSRPRAGHPLAPHITITRDKSGLQQSILKVPQWLKEEWLEPQNSPLSEKSLKSNKLNHSDLHNNDLVEAEWPDRGAADGNSNQPDSDFDEFSSQCSSSGNICIADESPVQPIAQCRAIYPYTPNLTDELALRPGDLLSVYQKQDDGWWLGECGGNVGIFPATYVEIIH